MINQLQRHIVITFGTKQRVFSEAIDETLLKRFRGQHSVASGVSGYVSRDDLGKAFSDLLVTYIAVKPIITDSLKAFWQDVLHHLSDELDSGEGLVLNLSCFMIPIPVTDRFTVIFFNPANRDRRRYDILCQVLSQPLSAGRYLSGLKESDKAFWIIFPCRVDVFFNSRIGDIFPEHFQEMVLPFFVHHIVGDIRNRFPLSFFIKSSGSHEDMKMRVIMSGSSCGLQDDNVTDVEFFYPGASLENIFDTSVCCSHEWAEQFWITKEPDAKKLRHGQDYMSISYSRQQSSSDEICPSVGIDLCTGKTEAALTGESDSAYLSTVAATVLDKAHLFRIAAVEHFLDYVVIVRTVKVWMGLFKRIPVIVEYLLECVFVYAFHGCSQRTTIAELAK